MKMIRERLKVVTDRQKTNADMRRKDIQYEIGEKVFLKVSVRPRKIQISLKGGKLVISVKIRNFSRSRMTKRTSPLESSREI